MILIKTPLRISLFGGGTDLPGFCSRYSGHVLTGAINKYVYVAVKERFDGKTRVCYSQTELVDDPSELKHDIIRSALVKSKLRGVDVVTFSDVHHNGTGLGTSSALAVGMVHAIYALRGIVCEQYEIADEASKIEIKSCKKPIGKQDQFACALGGVRELTFTPGDDQVGRYHTFSKFNQTVDVLNKQMLLFRTDIERNGDQILREQSNQIHDHVEDLKQMVRMAREAGNLLWRGRVSEIGPLLHESWLLKRSLANGISNSQIDEIYSIAREAGATGGKVCGAGGGGYMMFMASPERHKKIIAALPMLQHIPFQWDFKGTEVSYSCL